MIVLGIETSCDETALCLLETRQNGGDFEYKILANIVNSQIDLHREYGGVFPALAKREHIKNLPILYKQILTISAMREDNIDLIAVTQGPGLEPALWTGIVFAKELGEKLKVPAIPVNHMEGHIVSTLPHGSNPDFDLKKLKSLQFPSLALLISGGHTEIVRVEKIGQYKIIGRTMDDAVGEAFDKVARMLQLPYPGGPEVSKLAEQARKENLPKTISLPRPMINSKDSNFSFSGLKTAVLYTLKEIGNLSENQKIEICREFENAVTDVLISKTRSVMDDDEYKILIVGGGVIANTHIRLAFEALAKEYGIPLYLPPAGLTGDNALMIALAGALKPKTLETDFKADGNLSLDKAC
ncbi:MAG: tRNA (adenosine(37)-N6)-threonylcarbamoyltransferase complex transferase subunit TsaD [bacterium]|nr:tRNA (adenosine(37)-N6)-threonylcarbamoyltransferase complex transferase subunit TsaD [bacterium]